MKQADEGKVQLSLAALLSLKREFKFSGQIGDPRQTEKLTFVSLTNQIDYGIKCGYPEDEIIAAVTRSIAPQNFLCTYIENERLKYFLHSQNYGKFCDYIFVKKVRQKSTRSFL